MTDTFEIIINIKLDEIEQKYAFPSNATFRHIKRQIVNDIFTNSEKYSNFKYMEFNNVTPKIYRNFGKICLANGPISGVFDNRFLYEFFNENQEVNFDVIPIEEDPNSFESLTLKSGKREKITSNKLSNIIDNPEKAKVRVKEFIFNDNDFPPLS
jgi:uncharacterized protein YqfB (UPF0267 family)